MFLDTFGRFEYEGNSCGGFRKKLYRRSNQTESGIAQVARAKD
jgi:hypothetical protein